MSTLARLRPALVPIARTPSARGAERVGEASRAAEAALGHAAALRGAELGPREHDAEGAPLPSGPWHWSISHARGLAAAVVHDAPVGIDVERVRPLRVELVRGFLDEHELALLGDPGPLALARAWTAKEAVLKCHGVGLAALSRCRLLAPLAGESCWLALASATCRVRQALCGQHVLALHVEAADYYVDWPEGALPFDAEEAAAWSLA